MKSIRLIILVISSITCVLVSSQLDLTAPVFSTTNLNCLFGILMCGILFSVTFYLTSKMEGIDKKLYPQKSQLIYLLLAFGLMCFVLIFMAFSKNEFRSVNFYLYYLLFLSPAFTSLGIILSVRQKIRENKSE
jgi:membrane protein CcdC involved in cytochrome C biogenesis